MTITYLHDQHFSAPGGKLMKCSIPGLVFVMFSQDGCGICQRVMPMFDGMSNREMRVKFAVANVSKHRGIIGKARTTTTPIKGVPTLIMYNQGKPMAHYKGPRQIPNMMTFINSMVSKAKVPRQQNFVTPTRQQQISANSNGFSSAQSDLNSQRLEAKIVPDGIIPYNAPWSKYKSINGMTDD